MTNPSSRAQNHPKKGATIKVDPIRDLNAIQRIKKNSRLSLDPKARNTGFLRAGVMK